jgi:hypothetical protein
MRSYSNTKVINRNKKIGQYTSIGAFAILGLGFYITIKLPEQITFSFGALLLGFFLSQLGMYFTNRWGRTPRPDQLIEQGLKGLGREYTIYHYLAPAAHLLVGPAGVWAILPYQQAGTIRYEKNRWKLRGGGAIQNYMRFFGGEGIGRPDLDAASEIETMQRFFQRKLPEGQPAPEIQAALLFVHPKVELQANDSPLPAMKPKEFKEFIKNLAREETIPALSLETIRSVLPAPQQDV